MTCCGRQRMEFLSKSLDGKEMTEAVRLSYGGVQAIMVKGVFTGSLYRFAPGTFQSVHPADAPFMTAIPGLRPAPPASNESNLAGKQDNVNVVTV